MTPFWPAAGCSGLGALLGADEDLYVDSLGRPPPVLAVSA
jgi:hypothetical protein